MTQRADSPFGDWAPLAKDLFKLAENLLGGARAAAPFSTASRHFANKLDVVTRDEFDAAFAMLAKIRTAQCDLEERLDALEGKKAKRAPTRKKTPPAAKTKTMKKDKRKPR